MPIQKKDTIICLIDKYENKVHSLQNVCCNAQQTNDYLTYCDTKDVLGIYEEFLKDLKKLDKAKKNIL